MSSRHGEVAACGVSSPPMGAERVLISTFSLQHVTSQTRSMTCNVPGAGGVWGNCLDVACQADAADPSRAVCRCVKVVSQQFVTFGGNCDPAACTSVIWSAASADLSPQYISQMQALNQPVTVPGSCPTPKSF
jgi:hypothetical protein